MTTKHFVVVKHAGPTWHHYWVANPKDGVCYCNSAHESFTGKESLLEPHYDDWDKANTAAQGANIINPVGDYAACPVEAGACTICNAILNSK